MNIFSKKSILTLIAIFAFSFSLVGIANAQDTGVSVDSLFGGDDVKNEAGDTGAAAVQATTGLGAEDPRQIAASVINVILGFLGIIAVVLILAGGFRWMTAQGNDDAIAGAKNLMVAGVVGLVIILAAFGIAKFVIEALVGATT